MPEGPEIHRAANKIRKALEGMVIEDIEITVPRYSESRQDFIGKTVNLVEARGKAMLIHFDEFWNSLGHFWHHFLHIPDPVSGHKHCYVFMFVFCCCMSP